MNINEALIYYSKQLEKINNDYKLSYIEVQTIIMHTLNISKTKLISEGLRELTEEEINTYSPDVRKATMLYVESASESAS